VWASVGSTVLSTGLSVARAPLPRERFVGFACMNACMAFAGGLVGMAPLSVIVAVCALLGHAGRPREPNYVTGWGRNTWRT